MARKASKSKTTSSAEGKDAGTSIGARPVWSGDVRLSLVSVPVKLFSATSSSSRISFHQIHEPSGKRVRYQKIVPGIGPIDTDEIVKGFELSDDQYVLIEPDEIDALKLEAKKTLDLVQFVEQAEIDPIWFDRPYYLVPDGERAEEAYEVLRDALRRTKRMGLGQFIMRGREYVAALKPCGSGLLLETLRFEDEVRQAAPYFSSIAEEKPDRELLELATELIDRKTAPFSPERFKDQYTVALRDLIEAKAKKQKPVEIEEGRTSGGGAKVINLVDALKRSVKDAEKGKKPSRQAGNKRKRA